MLGKVLESIVKTRVKKIGAKKLEKMLNKVTQYVEEPNELDIQMKQVLKTLSKQGKYIEEISKDVAILQCDSHPAQEYICCKKCGCEIAKIKRGKE